MARTRGATLTETFIKNFSTTVDSIVINTQTLFVHMSFEVEGWAILKNYMLCAMLEPQVTLSQDF